MLEALATTCYKGHISVPIGQMADWERAGQVVQLRDEPVAADVERLREKMGFAYKA